MNRFKNILLIFDPKAHTQAVIDRAEALAKDNAARLTLLSVYKYLPPKMRMAIVAMPPQELSAMVKKERQAQMDELVNVLREKGINVSSKVLSGSPFLEIIRQVLREKHDLVIIAAEGKGGLKERLFGSTSMHLMRKCPCPVWVVKNTPHKNYLQVLAAVDLTEDFPDDVRDSLNPLIIQLASSMALMNKAELHAVQVWSVYGEGYMEMRGGLHESSTRKLRKEVKKQYTRQLQNLLGNVELGGMTVHKHLPRADDVSKAIVSLVKNKKIDLLVMGTVCRTGVAGFIIGNTAENVLNKVDCSVLTVKPEGFVTPVTLEPEDKDN